MESEGSRGGLSVVGTHRPQSRRLSAASGGLKLTLTLQSVCCVALGWPLPLLGLHVPKGDIPSLREESFLPPSFPGSVLARSRSLLETLKAMVKLFLFVKPSWGRPDSYDQSLVRDSQPPACPMTWLCTLWSPVGFPWGL